MNGLLKVALLPVLTLPAVVCAAPPEVVSLTPANGDQEVSADVVEIRVVFDQPMGKGASWVGQGDFIDGDFKWADDKTCVLPVKLEPGTDYSLSINSQRFTYFRSVKGEPATPFPFSFRTAGSTPRPPVTPDTNRQATRQLRAALESAYSYRDRVVKDWDAAFARHASDLEKAATAIAYARAAGKLLGAAQDPHIWLKAAGQTVGSHSRSIERNYNAGLLTNLLGWKEHNEFVATADPVPGVGYVLIRSWAFADPSLLEPALSHIANQNHFSSVIIDVRPNGGGSEPMARLLAGCFVDKPVVYSKNRNITGNTDGARFTKVFDRVLRPNRGKPWIAGGSVFVLMGEANMSSCESFLLMMKQVPDAILVGSRSYGSSGNPKPHELANGVEVYLPSWQALDESSKQLEGIGIEPDIKVDAPAEKFRTSDPVIGKVLMMLMEKE